MPDERNPEIETEPKKYTARQDFEGSTVVDPGGTAHTGTFGGGSATTISDTEPSDSSEGSAWIDTSGEIYR